MAPTAVSPPPVAIEPYSSVKPHGILKRKRSPLSGSTTPTHHTPSKRQKVAFEPDVDFKTADGSAEKDVALIREEIAHAIHTRDEDGNERLAELKADFDPEDGPSNTVLCKNLLALISNAQLLNKVPDVVSIVINYPWLGRDDTFVTLYTRFLGHLVSSQGGFLYSVLKMLVANLAHVSTSLGNPHPALTPSRSKLHARVHTALKYILALVPSASTTLSTVVAKSFPAPHDTKQSHVQYVRSLLKIIGYAPELNTILLNLVIERLIKLDCQVQIDVDDLEEEVGDVLSRGEIARLDYEPLVENDDPISDAESDCSDDEDLDPAEVRLKTLKSTVEKMDSLLDELFVYHSGNVSKTPNATSSASFNNLLSQFRNIILPTYRSRHTQFILFHFAQSSPEATLGFVDACINTLTDRTKSTVVRSSAAAYIASFIARAARISSEVVLHVFDRLGAYSARLRRENESTCRIPDLRRYGVYYATVQALVYIFCFRWRDLLDRGRLRQHPALDADSDVDDDEDTPDVDELLLSGTRNLPWATGVKETLTLNFYSTLNPLKICAPEIIEEFARIAHYLGFMYIYQILGANKQLRLHQWTSSASKPSTAPSFAARENSLTNVTGERQLQLDAYFPFDPYNLPISKRWIEGDYNDWRGVPGMDLEVVEASQGQSHGQSHGESQSSQAVAGRAEFERASSEEEEESGEEDESEEEDEDDEDGDDVTA